MRSMLLAPLAVVGLAYAAQGVRSAKIGTGPIEGMGACDVRPESVSCWDMDGAKSADLENGVRTALASGNEVQFRFGKKNRVLVFRHPQGQNYTYRVGTNNSLYGNWTVYGDPVTEFVRLPADPSDREATVNVQAMIQAAKDEEIAFREGVVGQIDGHKMEIGASSKVVPTKPTVRLNYGFGQPRQLSGWNVVLGISDTDNQYVNWTYTALDSSGQPIKYVDAQGKPITAMKALALEPKLQNNGNGFNPNNGEEPVPKMKAAQAYFQGGGPGPAFRAATNIDPKSIGALRIRATHTESVDIGPFPLDPK